MLPVSRSVHIHNSISQGSAFIEFEDADKVEEISGTNLTFDDNPLELMTKYANLSRLFEQNKLLRAMLFIFRRAYVVMKYEEHKDEEWAKKPWEERKKQLQPKKLVKFSNAADMGIKKVKVCDGERNLVTTAAAAR